MRSIVSPLFVRLDSSDDVYSPVTSVGAAGDYEPKTGKVEGAEDPCYGSAPGLPMAFCKYYAAHPEKRQGGSHPLYDPGIHLYFPKADIEKAREQQKAYEDHPTLYAIGHYAREAAVPVIGGGLVGLKWGVAAGVVAFGALGVGAALGHAIWIAWHRKQAGSGS